ncbi:ABC transporter [Sporanaerobium hydrogeniformans]|uniref:ABC transporter n=1 Tax=Sporanaerobium hydrogeniformans TaxID=3072179 RepID=A0AC61D953_9FIRM|nr:ABC-F family ATP-binding cassette domain-containing protein [Sporanaerobium hydrogeniformans]PHV69810.1 ABC transporter [Sporanaerobium hydrogeniformans]
MIISCSNIKKAFDEKTILNTISFHIEEYEKVALIGNNGAGKTTLFKILTGELTADEGAVTYSKESSIGYLKQEMDFESGATVYEELLHVFDSVIAMEHKLHEMEEEIAKTSSLELIHAYDNLRMTFENNKGYEYRSLVKGVLKGLGFDKSVYDKPLSILSGGQKNRVALGKLLLEEPSLLLLDEPTNHLDIEAIEWLEGFLKAYKGAVIIISHDRYFLDKIVNKVIHLEFGRAFTYNGNYSDYVIKSEKEYEVAVKHFEKQQREIAKQQAVIAKLKQFNREKSLRRARSREKQLEKIERLDAPMLDNKPMQLRLVPRITSGNDVLTIKDLSKSFDQLPLFQNFNLQIKKEDKVALVGPNGVGKTTLFKIIMGELEASFGNSQLGSNVVIGYYDQEHMNLTPENTILSEIEDAFPDLKIGEIRNVLAAFLFTEDDVFKSISTLSGGEKGRVALAKIMLSKANFLILDEPTNHLDILSKEILESAICNYEGTVLYISHDRYFINQTATKIIEMNALGAAEYLGDYDYYVEKKKEKAPTPPLHSLSSTPITSPTKDDWKKQKEQQAKIKKCENDMHKLENSIEEKEARLIEIDELLCLEEVYTDFTRSKDLMQEKENLTLLIQEDYTKWEELSETLDSLRIE